MRIASSFLVAGVAGALALGGCSRIKINSGYIIDEQLVASVQPGIDNRASVQKLLGRPTFAAQFDAREWYYVSRNSTQLAILTPRPKTQSIIMINFDAKGNVAKVERRGLEKVANLTPSKDKTPTLGRDTSFFGDLFGNIGQFGSAPGGVGSGTAGPGRDGPR